MSSLTPNQSERPISLLDSVKATVVEAIITLGLRTVKEIRQYTEAGDGCTCCHHELRRLLTENAPLLMSEAG